MKMTHLRKLYEADKRILGFSPHTLKAYSLQFKVLVREIGNLSIGEVTLDLFKEYLARQSERLKPSSMGHRIRFIRSLFRFAFKEGLITKNPTTHGVRLTAVQSQSARWERRALGKYSRSS